MQEHYRVRISGDSLVFSAAHFITLGPDRCEQLHGHNYRVAAEVSGPLDENHCVVDFLVLRQKLAAILGELDHRVLLPAQSASIRVTASEENVTAAFGQRRWVFPRGDCALLPVANTTAELLARYVAGRILACLESGTGFRPGLVRVEIEESFGQSAMCELEGG
jgi:6-pyruvoyltetrahydropterin/6-carboxytetrahydropterin synthase